MLKHLFFWIAVAFVTSAFAQAPSWQWASEAASSSNEAVWHMAYDTVSNYLYAGGTFSGDLSAKYGSSFTSSYGNKDGFLAKYDQLGNVVWALKVGGTSDDEVSGVAVDPSGNVYICGYFNSTADFDPSASTYTLTSAGGKDGFLAKYNSSGAFQWAVNFSGSSDELCYRMYADNNGIYVAGSYDSGSATFYSYSSGITKVTYVTAGQSNMFGVKYNASGIAQWAVSGGGSKDDNGYDVVADTANVYFTGNYSADITFKDASGVSGSLLQAEQNNKSQVFIIAFTKTGLINWQNNITTSSGGRHVYSGGITLDAANLYLTGYSDGNIDFKYPSPVLTQAVTNGGYDLYLAKLVKSSGTFSWAASATGSGTGDQVGNSVKVDMNGNLILTGYFTTGLDYSSVSGPSFTTATQDPFITSYSNAGSFLWSMRGTGSTYKNVNALALNNAGGIYIGGEHGGGAIFGTYTLSTGGSGDIFVAKAGCSAIPANTIASSQTVCSTSSLSLSGSTQTLGLSYQWQSSANSSTWTSAAGTSTSQNYTSAALPSTTYFRRIMSGTGACTVISQASQVVTISVNQAPSTANAGLSQTVCATSATLSATTPTAGSGLWSVAGGTASVNTPTSINSMVSGLAVGTNSFVWTVSSGVCAPSAATVSITRNAAPTASAGLSQTICSTSVTLNAVTPTVGTGLWSVSSGSGSIASATNPGSAVNVLAAGTNVLVWTVSNGVCTPATASITIRSDVPPTANAGLSQTICAGTATLSAIAPTVGVGSWSLASGSGSLSAPGSYSSAISSLGTGTNQFVWTVTNGVCPAASASVNIIRDVQPTANAGSNQSLCASVATLAAISPSIGSGNWSLLTGNGTIAAVSSYSSSITNLGTGTNQFVWTVTNGVCPPASSTVTLLRDVQPTANAGADQTVCAASTTLGAVSPTVGAGSWSLLSGTAAISSATNASSSVSALGTGTNNFLWTVSNGSCPSATAMVSVVRQAQPTASAGTDQTVCASSATLAAVSPSIGSGSWSLLTGSGTIAAVSSYSSSISNLGAGTNQFVWTVTNGVCPPASSTVALIRNVQPTANAGISQTICTGTATLSAVVPTVGVGSWSLASGSGSLSAPGSYSSAISSLGTGTNQFVWTVTNGVCPAASASVNIIRDAQPVSNAGSNQTVCATTATLAAISPSIGSGNWSLLTGSGTIAVVSSYSSSITNLGTGTNQFVWTVTNGVCPPASSTVTLARDIQPTANAGISQTICAGTATLSAIAPTVGVGSWSLASGSGSLSAPGSYSSAISSLGTGTNQFVWTVTNGVCPAASASVNIIRDVQPTANAGSNQSLCASVATLAAVSPSIGSGNWSLLTGTGTIAAVSSYSSSISNLGTGTNQFVWTVTNGVCPPASSTVTLLRDVQPTANAGADQTVCAASATLSAVSPTVGAGSWSLLSGTAAISSATNASSSVSALGTGTNSFLWTVSNGSCPSATAMVSVARQAQPTASAGTDQTVCASSATLAAVSPSIGSGSWSVLSGTGTVNTPTNPASGVIALGSGINTFIWTVVNGICPAATSTVMITREIPISAVAGSNQSVCASSATLGATSPTAGTGSWSLASGAGSIATPSNPTSAITGLGTGTNSFVWSVNYGVCPIATSTVIIINYAQPTASAGTDQTVCASSATLAAVFPSIGSGSWSVLSGTGTVNTPTNPASTVSALGTGTTTFLWTVNNGVCPSATSAISITRDQAPTANAGSNQTVCLSTATMSAVSPTIGSGSWSVLSGSGTIVSANSPSTQVLALAVGNNSLLWSVTSGSCPVATSTVVITRSQGLSANAGLSQSVCATSATLGATTPTAGTGQWSVLTGTAAIVTSTNPGTAVTALNTGMNTFLWTVSSGSCPTATAQVNVWRDVQPTANAGTNQNICTSTATLSAVSPTVGSGVWSIVSGSASSTSLNNPLAVFTSIATGTNVFMWTVSNGVCPAATSTVSVVRDAAPVAIAGVDQTVCAQSATLSATTPSAGTGTWSVLSGSATIASYTNPASSLSALGTGTTVLLWTVTNGICPSATAAVAIIQEIPPSASAGPDQTLCADSVMLTAQSPSVGSGYWSLAAGSGSLSQPGSYSCAVTGLATGTNSFIWTVSNGVCPPASSTVTIVRDMNPGAVSAGNNFTLCASSCTLSATTTTPGNTSWSVYSGTGSISSVNNPTTLVTGLSSGINQFIISNTNGSCPPARDTVSVYYQQPLPPANAGADQRLCTSSCTLAANNAGYGSWSLLSGSGTITSTSSASTTVTALGTGTNSFVWSVSQAFCPGTSDTVFIYKDAAPSMAVAGPDQRVCGSSATLSATAPLTGKGSWQILSGQAVVSDNNQPQASVSGLSTGNNQFVWIVTNGVCPPNADTLSILSDAEPSTPFAGKDLLVCQDHIQLDADVPLVGDGHWSVLSGTCAIQDPAAPTTSVTGLQEGICLLKWTITNGVCEERSDTLQITRTITPTDPDAGPDQLLETSTTELHATIPQAGIGTWSVISGSCEISDLHNKNTAISGLPFGNTILRWTISNKSCPDVYDDILIDVKNLNIPNAFSPNGDGINDRFVITSLAYYKNVKLSVFNSWGTLLYHNDRYENNWEGLSSDNEKLADDTYYYIIEIEGLKNFTGFVILKRNQ